MVSRGVVIGSRVRDAWIAEQALVHPRPDDLAEVVEHVADAFRPDVETAGRRLVAALARRFPFSGDHHLLSQLLVNLVENAARTHTGGYHPDDQPLP